MITFNNDINPFKGNVSFEKKKPKKNNKSIYKVIDVQKKYTNFLIAENFDETQNVFPFPIWRPEFISNTEYNLNNYWEQKYLTDVRTLPEARRTLIQKIISTGYVGDKKIENYNFWNNEQRINTPYYIVDTMIEQIRRTDLQSVYFHVYFSIEFVEQLRFKYGVDPSKIIFITDNLIKCLLVQRLYGVAAVVMDTNNFNIGVVMPKTDNLVILGNPPYNTGGNGNSNTPLYNKFVEMAINMNPKYLSMIIPSRWMIGGKGLGKFREKIQNDRRMKMIKSYMSPTEVFPGATIAGGVCYFLWARDYDGQCSFNGKLRDLNRYDIIITNNDYISILEKVISLGNLKNWVATRNPYGIPGHYDKFIDEFDLDGIRCLFKSSIGVKTINKNEIKDPRNDINQWKVIAPRHPISGNDDLSKQIKILYHKNVIIIPPGMICSETHLLLRTFNTEIEAINYKTYVLTKFFNFMLKIRLISQDTSFNSYNWIPDLGDYLKPWTDTELFLKFQLTEDEISFINSQIKD
jgi:site-specific DNA-methyltransferase (adenine-specific)